MPHDLVPANDFHCNARVSATLATSRRNLQPFQHRSVDSVRLFDEKMRPPKNIA
ncbi:hypothetical protein [Burkholderia stagnalis]|uniref:hypothetical protein n=1 Tax=Burkholderia stagnalis TaxID=1503054 RepID=UPI000ADDBF6F|nr:hypothetical protein [Burkholderia stagnalis]MDY7804252.1 hypothetical protein [Burkholderia stagnalis]